MVRARKYSGDSSRSESFIMGQLMPHISVMASRASRLLAGDHTATGALMAGVALVAHHLKVFVLVVEDGVRFALDVQRGVGDRARG